MSSLQNKTGVDTRLTVTMVALYSRERCVESLTNDCRWWKWSADTQPNNSRNQTPRKLEKKSILSTKSCSCFQVFITTILIQQTPWVASKTILAYPETAPSLAHPQSLNPAVPLWCLGNLWRLGRMRTPRLRTMNYLPRTKSTSTSVRRWPGTQTAMNAKWNIGIPNPKT